MNHNEIVAEIVDYIRACGGNISNWYAGIAADPRTRLFSDHMVSEKIGHWIFRSASTVDQARYAEKQLLALGCDGGPSGGDNTTNTVYAYKKTMQTRQ